MIFLAVLIYLIIHLINDDSIINSQCLFYNSLHFKNLSYPYLNVTMDGYQYLLVKNKDILSSGNLHKTRRLGSNIIITRNKWALYLVVNPLHTSFLSTTTKCKQKRSHARISIIQICDIVRNRL